MGAEASLLSLGSVDHFRKRSFFQSLFSTYLVGWRMTVTWRRPEAGSHKALFLAAVATIRIHSDCKNSCFAKNGRWSSCRPASCWEELEDFQWYRSRARLASC